MKNLILQGHVQRSLLLSSVENPQHIVDICPILGEAGQPHFSSASTSSTSNHILLTNHGLLMRVDGDGRVVWKTCLNQVVVASGDHHEEDQDEQQQQVEDSSWFSLAFISPNLVCLSSKSGAIVSVSPETGAAELVGEFENGIHAGAWSADGEVLVLVTLADADDNEQEDTTTRKKSVLLSMNTQWEVLAEVDIERHLPCSHLSSDDANNNNNMDDNKKVSVCWRPDSTLCAISSVDEVDSMRKIRMYKRETLDLHAVGRTEDGSGRLIPNIQSIASTSSSLSCAWAGPGCSQLLACVQRKGKKSCQVVFLEPNGLQHGEFPLRIEDPSDSDILGLDWSRPGSDLLVVALRHFKQGCDVVQLWHRSNYHWYFKKEFRYTDRKVVCAKFHRQNPSTLHVVFQSDDMLVRWNEYVVRWDTSTVQYYSHREQSSSSSSSSSSCCTAFVIDGCRLNATPLDKALVPPPMYAASSEFALPVSDIVFSRTRNNPLSSIMGVVILSDGSCAAMGEGGRSSTNNKTSELVLGSYKDQPTLRFVAKWRPTATSDEGVSPTCLRNFVIVGEENNVLRMVAIAASSTCGGEGRNNCESLVEISLSLREDNEAEVAVTGRIQLEGRVLCVIPWLDSPNGALIQLEDGQLLEYESRRHDNDAVGTVMPSEAEPLLEPCPWIAALRDMSRLCDQEHSQRQRLVVGLSSSSRLYCHDLLLSDYASSFVLSPMQQYLCYTTSGTRCQLRFLSLTELANFDPLMGSDGNNLLQGYEPRKIERGGTLVAVFPNKPTVVLQLPRGNLEGVYPRALVLRHVVLIVKQGDFQSAFEMMRRQKVDLNLMVDLDPIKFLEPGGHAETLVEQVANIDHLNLFLSSLQNWDSTSTRFVIPSWWLKEEARNELEETEPFDYESKVNQTCQRLRSIMIEAERNGKTKGGRVIREGHFLLPILSTFAKENPPKLEAALNLIKENALAKHATTKSKKPPLFAETAQSSIQYLAFLADYELLFETALGMYDYDIARACARNSQMDPKVYLPMLKRYRELPTYCARFQVDMRLKRYESALRNLYESGSRDESLDDVPVDACAGGGDKNVGNGFDECLSLIEEQHLYQLGLELFRDAEQRAQIMLSLGDHLLEEKQANTALSVFLASKPPFFERAKGAARLCRDWGAFFTVVAMEGGGGSGNDGDGDDASEATVLQRRQLAREVANELVADAQGHFNRREKLADAARVLWDYVEDAHAAVDVLLQAEMWSEAQRLGHLCQRGDLVRKCREGAVSYAHTAINDLEERGDAFCVSLTRFAEVLELRKEAILRGESNTMSAGAASENDDNGSLFSAASNASHLSTASNTSTGTISSVISAKSTSSFSLSGADHNRHKSKFNQVGGGKQKRMRKKKGKGRTKSLPGSQQELDGLVQTLRSNCVDENYRDEIAETITFLARSSGHVDVAKCLYDTYITVSSLVQKSQQNRIEKIKKERLRQEKRIQREGINIDFQQNGDLVPMDAEKEVDALAWERLPDELVLLFSFLPTTFDMPLE